MGRPEPPTDECLALAWLVETLGRARARERVGQAGSAEAALAGMRGATLGLRRLKAQLREMPCRLIAADDCAFPSLLRDIPDAPLLLYVAGSPEILSAPAIGIVGARRCTHQGAANAGWLARELAAAGLVIVSGLARGIDAAAHRGALGAGATVAVLGAGLSCIYPADHRPLAAQIIDSGGAIVSEYSPTTPPRPFRFPERNRIVSGLVLAVLVVEAGERSGSLITARLALEQGREVLALPGSIHNPLARGCHRLLREGAGLVETPLDIAGFLRDAWPDSPRSEPAADRSDRGPPDRLAPALENLLAFVGHDPVSIDELAVRSALPISELIEGLTELEISGFVERIPGGYIRGAWKTSR